MEFFPIHLPLRSLWNCLQSNNNICLKVKCLRALTDRWTDFYTNRLFNYGLRQELSDMTSGHLCHVKLIDWLPFYWGSETTDDSATLCFWGGEDNIFRWFCLIIFCVWERIWFRKGFAWFTKKVITDNFRNIKQISSLEICSVRQTEMGRRVC